MSPNYLLSPFSRHMANGCKHPSLLTPTASSLQRDSNMSPGLKELTLQCPLRWNDSKYKCSTTLRETCKPKLMEQRQEETLVNHGWKWQHIEWLQSMKGKYLPIPLPIRGLCTEAELQTGEFEVCVVVFFALLKGSCVWLSVTELIVTTGKKMQSSLFYLQNSSRAGSTSFRD